MNETQIQKRLAAGVGGPDLWDLRRETGLRTGIAFQAVGQHMVRNESAFGVHGDSVRAMGCLLQMGGELAFAASRMLSGNEHYAGAALVRQIVEIEYLTWTFKEGQASVIEWLNSSFEERMKTFSPKKLRSNAKGRFLFKDYQDHCEQGGHPVPRGIFLLGGREVGSAQLLLVDLLTHCWRTWDQVLKWFTAVNGVTLVGLPPAGREISQRLYEWGKCDPIYALMVEVKPEVPPPEGTS